MLADVFGVRRPASCRRRAIAGCPASGPSCRPRGASCRWRGRAARCGSGRLRSRGGSWPDRRGVRPSGENTPLVSQAGLSAVRLRGAAPPAAGTVYRSKLVDQASVLPAMRTENTTLLPSGLKRNSSRSPNGFDGTSPSSVPDRLTGAALTRPLPSKGRREQHGVAAVGPGVPVAHEQVVVQLAAGLVLLARVQARLACRPGPRNRGTRPR